MVIHASGGSEGFETDWLLLTLEDLARQCLRLVKIVLLHSSKSCLQNKSRLYPIYLTFNKVIYSDTWVGWLWSREGKKVGVSKLAVGG